MHFSTAVEKCIKNSADQMVKTHIVIRVRNSFNSSYTIGYNHYEFELK